MKVKAVIRRKSDGLLEAWIEQEGQKGASLLGGRSFSSIETAKIHIEQGLQKKFPGIQIRWKVENYERPPQ